MTSDAPAGRRALVVDDHRIFAEALACRLRQDERFVEVRTAFSTEQAITLSHAYAPHVLLVDVGLEDRAALALVARVLQDRDDVTVVMMSGRAGTGGTADVVEALSAGVMAWVPKDTTFADLVRAIDEALSGRVWLPTGLMSPVVAALLAASSVEVEPRSYVDDLTPRQLEVLECLAAGMTRAQIARWLVVSPHTVRTHVQDVLRKAGVHSTLAALAKARRDGRLGPTDRTAGVRGDKDIAPEA